MKLVHNAWQVQNAYSEDPPGKMIDIIECGTLRVWLHGSMSLQAAVGMAPVVLEDYLVIFSEGARFLLPSLTSVCLQRGCRSRSWLLFEGHKD